ncbi:TolC family protein [Mucilaginibacter aquariorum]|uniref:TolC family protein n=1 Tax=Mucilaginibacter aquariorum TaxID=2967225 RepID=A0ABT1T5U0_9SPHI|nr:TolC family protein [Mucilaginibacter aquariorum]MCQ6959303.1 TolC family protein [Mucilaginibacter aquariorum]
MKNRTFYYFAPILMAIFATQMVYGQGKLDAYIQEGLATNQSIKQQNFVLEKSVYALKEAKSMFLPEVTFSTTYTKANGGRTIDFPTGDLFNGVYATLNQLTGTNAFPQLQNQKILLNPDNFYDAKFRTTLPILNAELIYNKRIKKQQVDLQKAEVLLYKRELVKEIKTAYYSYQKAVYATGIYESSLRLVEEGQRINTKLYENSKVNRTVVLRSQNEVSKINASLTGSRKTAESARYYFNFLLNRPLTDSVILDDIKTLPARDQLLGNSVTGREELSKLRIAKDINGNLTGLAKSYIVPKLGTFIDLGSQAFDWKFNSNSRYYLFGISLEWNLFSSGKNNYRVKQAIADREALASQTDYVQQQLFTELKVRQASMQSAIAQYEAAQSQLKTSQIYYGDMLKLYKQGMAIYIELLDAQNQWIDAQLHANIALYDTWIADAAIERANASFTIQ